MKTQMLLTVGAAVVMSTGPAFAQAAPNGERAPSSCTQPTCDEKDAACGPALTEYRACTSRSSGVWVQHATSRPKEVHDPGAKSAPVSDGSAAKPATPIVPTTGHAPVSLSGSHSALPAGRASTTSGMGSSVGHSGMTRSPAASGGPSKR